MILRICVVIPCFNHPRTISRLVKDVVEQTSFPVLLLDDGSETPVSHTLYSFEVKQAQEQGRVRVVRFDQMQGKGAMLRYAIQDLVAQGFTHMVTLDDDGRHLASEIKKLVEVAKQHPWDLVLGNRGIKEDAGNLIKRVSRKVLSYCVRYETGSQIQDTRSGFRVYPLFPLQTMRFRTKRYDFELEVLIRLIWKGFTVREIPVEIAPFDPTEHQDHFNKFWDSLRISLLNLTLLCLSLLNTHNAPSELALAIGLGIFVGCTPAFGFHTLMVIALAVVLRLNFVALWLGTHVSTPILFPFVLMAEVYIGQHWLHIVATEGMMGHIYQWTAGSLVLGVLLGVPGAIAAYLLARSMQKKTSVLENSGPTFRYRLLALITKTLGLRAAYAWVQVSSVIRYLNRFNARRGLSEYYRILFPTLSFWPRQRLIVRHLREVGRLNADALIEPRPAVRDEAGFASALAQTPEAIVLTGNVGVWSLSVSSPAREFRIDPIVTKQSEILPFLGKLAVFDVSAFHAAIDSGQPLIASFVIKTEAGYQQLTRQPRTYKLHEGLSREAQVYEWASRFIRHFEHQVRQTPAQWFNIYPFFSTKPRTRDDKPAILL